MAAAAVQPALDVAGLQPVLHLVIERRPHAGEAIGLQLHPHLQLIGLALAARILLQRLHAVGNTQQRLHVMADLMRNHIGLREVAGRAEAPLQVVVERKIDVHFLVGRTIERPHRRLAGAARRARGAA